MDAQIPFRRLVGFYATQLSYIVAGSAFLAFFILPEFGVIVSDLLWKIFVEKQFRVVVFVLCVVAVFRYLFRRNNEEIEINREEMMGDKNGGPISFRRLV